MTFYQLLDPVRSGDVIRAEGRKHYRYSFGPCRWVRTTVMMAYMNPGSPLYGMYQKVSETDAQGLLIQKSAVLAGLLSKAESLAEKYDKGRCSVTGLSSLEHSRAVAEQLDDLEQKITAWIYDLPRVAEIPFELLVEEGFTPEILQAVRVLTQPEEVDYVGYIQTIRTNSVARAVKIADLLQNMDLNYLPCVTEADQKRAEQYRAALAYLELEKDLSVLESARLEAPFVEGI